MIKAILFDIGDVLVCNSFDLILQELAKNLNVEFSSLSEIKREYNQELVTGKMSVLSFNKILKDRFDLSLSPEEISSVWRKTYKKIRTRNKDLFNLAKKLKENYRVGIISNIYDLTAKIERERGLLDPFDPCILSCEVGLAKPDKEIFELALKKLNLKAEECLFIDNRENCLEEPRKLGFNVILFENNKKFLLELKPLIGDGKNY